MTDTVQMPFDAHTKDNAVLLLAAAEELGLDPGVVKTAEGMFIVPKEVHDKAFPPRTAKKADAPAKKAAKKK